MVGGVAAQTKLVGFADPLNPPYDLLARKEVPDKADFPAITFRMDTLHRQSGITPKLFAFDVRKIAERQPLPEYGLRIDRKNKHELVTFCRDHSKSPRVPHGFKFRIIEGR